VNEKFQELIESENLIIVDAMQKMEEVENEILGHVFEKMRNIGELGKLWIEWVYCSIFFFYDYYSLNYITINYFGIVLGIEEDCSLVTSIHRQWPCIPCKLCEK